MHHEKERRRGPFGHDLKGLSLPTRPKGKGDDKGEKLAGGRKESLPATEGRGTAKGRTRRTSREGRWPSWSLVKKKRATNLAKKRSFRPEENPSEASSYGGQTLFL